jgi:hypothetical protein
VSVLRSRLRTKSPNTYDSTPFPKHQREQKKKKKNARWSALICDVMGVQSGNSSSSSSSDAKPIRGAIVDVDDDEEEDSVDVDDVVVVVVDEDDVVDLAVEDDDDDAVASMASKRERGSSKNASNDTTSPYAVDRVEIATSVIVFKRERRDERTTQFTHQRARASHQHHEAIKQQKQQNQKQSQTAVHYNNERVSQSVVRFECLASQRGRQLLSRHQRVQPLNSSVNVEKNPVTTRPKESVCCVCACVCVCVSERDLGAGCEQFARRERCGCCNERQRQSVRRQPVVNLVSARIAQQISYDSTKTNGKSLIRKSSHDTCCITFCTSPVGRLAAL